MLAVSYLSPNLLWLYQSLGDSLGQRLGCSVAVVQGEFDPLDDPDLAGDRWDLLFICGLPLMRYGQSVPHQLRPLVAPVMDGARYGGQPVYLSDVVVRADSDLHTWDDLAQSVFCYNDRGSHSGYSRMGYELSQRGLDWGFFRQRVESGGHLRSLHHILMGQADCGAIDSTVLDQALRTDPALGQKLRIVTSLGPSPMPPIAVSQRLGQDVIFALQQALLQPDAALQKQLAQAGMLRFAAVDWASYGSVLAMYGESEGVGGGENFKF
ncbi:phosphate/phosphite/phosphonate ABC transporter substrate-binding protein [Nodosilinea sp. PGN35]|uniref:phosphate/phosphite/phosphonate ABC transporter substrate-binding protein n=1 Tax=Nodosilinea sp. PGN35 TaxID=3020489 RepID=UPI0023B260A7|nr:PhnD/SsuA/transferrin family substrate-binding protein [Nodosilinea sp. TSF1-S3]MDF0366542.1 PhnD/SsuA/transferrin family substrate-binding protein [Nodosilinea sp. TSF1-S3]